MLKLKKLIAMLLALTTVLLPFASCSENEDPAETTAEAPSAALTDTGEAETTEEGNIFAMNNEMHDVPSLDFEGEKFTVLYPEWQLYRFYLTTEEINGSTMNDAMYYRTLNTEDYLNVEIEMITTGYIDTIEPAIKNTVMAGDDAYDMFITHCINGLIGIISKNYALDWNDVPYVDFEKPYWNHSFTETLTVDGKTPFSSSDLLIADPNVIFFNKDILNDVGLEDPYNLVRDGKWTLDKMIEMAQQVSTDLNGDSKMTKSDQYGIIACDSWELDSFLHGCDQYIIKMNEDDYPEFILNSEKTVTIIEKMVKLFCENDTAYTNGVSDLFIPFDEYHGLFYVLGLAYAADYRETDVDFGILPMPKYDEAQTDYISLNWGGLQCLPKTTANLEMVGAVCEVLAYESREQVLPAYFENLLGYKIARDTESVEMLKIIFSNTVYDFGLNFSNQSGILHIIPNMISANSTDVASYIAKNEKSFLKTIEKVYESYLDME